MKLKLIQFQNTDHVLLPGLLFEPEKQTDRALIALHGNGSSGGMYSVELQNTMGESLTENGVSYFTFTNVGGHLIQNFDRLKNGVEDRVTLGVAYELIKDCIHDIDGAITFLKMHGYKHIYLSGMSTGANKICVYDYYKPENEIEKYILECGGDDSGIYYKEVGEKKFTRALQKCREKVATGHGRNLVTKDLSESPISYQSLLDQIDPNGNYNTFPFYWQLQNIPIMSKAPWREIQKIEKPTFVVYGRQDQYCHGNAEQCVNLIKKATSEKKNFIFKMIEDADHSFHGKRQELADSIVTFLSK